MPAMASAFGLGQIELESGLNQPFEARIEIFSATAEELSSLNIGLADMESFQRAGIDRQFLLSSLKFEVHETESGPDFIRVYSTDPIREPYLNFLLEASWSHGRLLREYTVLLDPPLYDPTARRPAVTAPAVTATTPSQSSVSETGPVEAEAEAFSPDTGAGGYSQGDYGPVAESETLWSIASAARPDAAISVQQMMLALLRANPEAFADNNINGLKRGQILRLPDREDILSLSVSEAMAEASAQNAMWRESRGLPAATPIRPVSTVAAGEPGDADYAEAEQRSSELRLLAASDSGTGSAQGDTGAAGSTGGAGTGASLDLANEQVETLTQENAELKSRLTEAEAIIEDLQRLISLKDDELASIQRQVAESGVPATAEEPVESAVTEAVTPDTTPAGAEQPATEETVTPVETQAEEAGAPAAAETPTESEPAPSSAAAPPPPPPEEPQTMVDQILGLVMENLVVAVGVTGGVIALIVIGLFLRSHRKAKMGEQAEETYAYAGESEEPTSAPAEEAEAEFKAAAQAPEPVAEEEEEEGPAAVDKTVFMAPEPVPAAAAAAEPEEDPLAEVNVFLAYEHFDQAEEFVRDAIAGNPKNLDFHTKLLEVFYASGDKAKYEAEARVLNEIVGGSGSHWDMAVAMWSEMSPNRALFEAGGVEEAETPAAKAAGGVIDLTAGEGKPGKAAALDVGLDFDLGDTTDVPAAKAAKSEEDVLDLTAAASLTEAITPESEDLLDVTAAVGLEPEPAAFKSDADEMVLDITSGSEAPASAENLLDISFQGSDNLLDVTSHDDTGTLSGEEDLLDVTAATGAGAGVEELLEIKEKQPGPGEKDDNLLDFDIGGLGATEPETSDIGGAGADAADIELSSADNVIEFDAGVSVKDDDLALDLGAAEEESSGLSLDDGASELDGGLELDLSIGDTDEPALELDTGTESEGGIEFDLTTEESGTAEVESTMKMPELELEMNDAEDEDDDHTVFVPRSSGTQEQSAEDEVATKLDLAKAYVELGDKDSAKGILEEIIRDGSAQQQATARDLLKQVT
jgi:pilus assembly protein FimV